MNGFEKMLSKWNFKKIAVIYVTLAVLALIACGVAVGVLYRERIAFATAGWKSSAKRKILRKRS